MFRPLHIFVIAASGRFIAESALKAGYAVSVIDLFRDADTDAVCRRSGKFLRQSDGGVQLSGQPRAFRCSSLSSVADFFNGESVSEFGSDIGLAGSVIVLGGGAENHPDLFRSIRFPEAKIAGPAAASIERLLDFDAIVACCDEQNISIPQVITSRESSAGDSKGWLKKQVRSGGGLQVERWDGSSPVDFQSGFYLQREVEGPTISGCYVAARSDGSINTRLIGVCGGHPRQSENDFRYTGSFGPVSVKSQQLQKLQSIGEAIAASFGLCGVFGIDFIDSPQGLMLIDINPRIPASAEIVERVYRTRMENFSIVRAHLDACLRQELPEILNVSSQQYFAKRVVYNSKDASPVEISFSLSKRLFDHPNFTDVPAAGTVVHPGQPFLTVHAEGCSEAELERALDEQNAAFDLIVAEH